MPCISGRNPKYGKAFFAIVQFYKIRQNFLNDGLETWKCPMRTFKCEVQKYPAGFFIFNSYKGMNFYIKLTISILIYFYLVLD